MPSKTIAWIDDDIDILDPVVKPLKKDGFTIKEYRNYGQALDHVQDIRECDLILLDLVLPAGGRDLSEDKEPFGLYLLKLLRSQYKVRVPVLIFSVIANGPMIDQEELHRLDADSLAKPIRPSQLREKVLKLLGISA